MIAKVYSAIPHGFEGKIIEVEGDINRGLPSFNIVGMANKTINESKERVRSAIVNSNFSFPDKKVTINLAPADLAKDGSHLDLPIALSILILSGQLLQLDTSNRLFVGELSLNGALRPIKGIINIIELAKQLDIKEIYVPLENYQQAQLISGVKIYGVDTLQNLFLHLKSEKMLYTPPQPQNGPKRPTNASEGPFLDDINGQELAKRALEISIAGHHNLLISGPPGAGKTMLAKVAASLQPDLSQSEQISVTKIYSIANLSNSDIILSRPYRHPHHTASASSIIGGGAQALPGEISLAHTGILFLDEIPEFQRPVLEALRQPLEDKIISISRANQKVTYPADFILIAAMNPCPCGFYNDPTHTCTCSELQIQNYQKRLSGPLLDRIDLFINVEKVKTADLISNKINVNHSAHAVVKNNITDAILLQNARNEDTLTYNGNLPSHKVKALISLSDSASRLLNSAADKLNLSARSYFKTIKVARTIADLDQSPDIKPEHITEALTFRKR